MSELSVRGLRVMRGRKTAVNGLTLSLRPGRITALIGPNGAGKSTLVLALAGILPIAAGTVELDGTPLTSRSPDSIRAAGVAAVPEGHRVLSPLSVDDNLRAAGFVLAPAGLAQALADVYGVFPELAERKSQRAGSLSGGQQQMLALGQALICRPKFILADEMSLGLAPLIVRRLVKVIEAIAAAGTGVLLIEQFTHVALKVADEAHVMSRGALTFSGDPETLMRDPEILHKAYLA